MTIPNVPVTTKQLYMVIVIIGMTIFKILVVTIPKCSKPTSSFFSPMFSQILRVFSWISAIATPPWHPAPAPEAPAPPTAPAPPRRAAGAALGSRGAPRPAPRADGGLPGNNWRMGIYSMEIVVVIPIIVIIYMVI